MLKFPQNQRFNQPNLEAVGRIGSILTKRKKRKKSAHPKCGKKGGEKANLPSSELGGREIFALYRLLGLNRAHGAGALASAAVDASTGVDFHVVAAHGDRAHGAGALASAAGDAGVTNFTCHVTYTSKVMF